MSTIGKLYHLLSLQRYVLLEANKTVFYKAVPHKGKLLRMKTCESVKSKNLREKTLVLASMVPVPHSVFHRENFC